MTGVKSEDRVGYRTTSEADGFRRDMQDPLPKDVTDAMDVIKRYASMVGVCHGSSGGAASVRGLYTLLDKGAPHGEQLDAWLQR